ncbi:MAG: DUF5666 domain-containing protein [Minisyncoccota bacterium]
MTKKIAWALGTLGLLSIAGAAFAQTATTTDTGAPAPAVTAPTNQMVLQVGPKGHILLRGTIDSVSASSITVKSWGGDWTVNVSSSAQVMPQGAALSSFQQGDFVGVQGTVDQSASWTVDATLVRDWTARQALNQERQQNVQSVREVMQGAPRTVQGTVSSLSGESFTLTTASNTAYAVSLTSTAKILQRHWLTLDFSQVQNGDTVRVWGPVASSTISASIFRDTSIPRAQ